MPASLSPRITQDLLRGELGFRGLVVADALDMGGITVHFDPGEAAVLAILAGADQVVKSPDLDAAVAGVRRAVGSGRIPPGRIDRSVERILAAKERFPAPRASAEAAFRIVDSPEHRALAGDIARRAVTLVREEPGRLPLSRGVRVAHVVVQRVSAPPIEALPSQLERRLGSTPETFELDARSPEEDVARAVEGASRADVVLLSLFIRSRSGEGSILVPPPAGEAISRIAAAGRPIVAVAFGSPYLLGELPAAATCLAAYGGQDVMQVAVAQALFAEIPITGRLPVTIPDVAARGDGIQKPATAAPPQRAAGS
jgi:hypothetical protein